jgi:hypothetical protein
MAVVASGILCLGFCMVLVTGILAAISVGNLRLARRLRRTVPTPIGTWGRRGVVSAEAVTEYGPAGPQTGPVSGEDCTWYELTVVLLFDIEEGASSHVDGGTSPAWPTLADGTGAVTIDPRLLTEKWGSGRGTVLETSSTEYVRERGADPPWWVPRGIARNLSIGDRVALREARLPRGREVFAMGRVRKGSLGPGPHAMVTPSHWADLIRETEDDLGFMAKAIPAFIVLGTLIGAGGLGLLLLVT